MANYLEHSTAIVSDVESIGCGSGDKENKNYVCIMLPYKDNPDYNGWIGGRTTDYNWYALTPEAAEELYSCLHSILRK